MLAEVRAAATSVRNLVPLLIDAARLHATEGEIVQALQDMWGGDREQPVVLSAVSSRSRAR